MPPQFGEARRTLAQQTGRVGLPLISETVIEEGQLWTLAVNQNQHLLGKSIIMLRRDCTAVVDVQDHEWANLQDEMRRLVGAIKVLFNPDQLNYAFLMNVDAQVHLHVIPRYAGARHWRDLVFEDVHWGSVFGQEQRILDSDALAALASEVRDQLQNVS
jgi:diadenosine tetraphosphate (Ap4A) HIT family hydrolase